MSSAGLLVLLVAVILGIASSYSVSPKSVGGKELKSSVFVKSPSSSIAVNRATFLGAALSSTCGLTFFSGKPAFAKEVDPALKGTKADPEYQACLGVCIYDCTKPKGFEQRTRVECLPECKTKCATTKEQLLLGAPIKKD